MATYKIWGGRPLVGEIPIHGAKNSVLPILAASLLCKGRCILRNCPHISDVEAALEILRCLGCEAHWEGELLSVDSTHAEGTEIPITLMRRMRAAVVFLGPLLARFGCARIYQPGGCVLGERPIDYHLSGLRQMGVRCEYEGETLCCQTERLRGCVLTLPFPSVGATENLLLAAVGCAEEVVICNGAKEPEIADLIGFLRDCGAEIDDSGPVLRVRGGRPLYGTVNSVVPDRMEAATYLMAGAITRGDVTLHGVRPEHLKAVTKLLRQGGCELTEERRTMRLRCDGMRAVGPIVTAPYDGFPTDAQAPMMALLTTARGASVMEETMFTHRFAHVPALQQMGAKIHATRRYAIVEGVERLRGACVEATDLRGGAAMVLAALSADGCSEIRKIEHMERGYTDMVSILQGLGADITME